MAITGKRLNTIKQKLAGQEQKEYTPQEAFAFLQQIEKAKFNEAVDVSFNLSIDPKKSDQAVRGVANLPNGLGKEVKVAVLTQPDKHDAAVEAGADAVGLEDLAERIKKDVSEFDVIIASPDAMPIVGKLGTVLGPQGKMPNPKFGTVTDNIAATVKSVKLGQTKFRADKGGVVHASIGKLDFASAQLEENFMALLTAVFKAKPPAAKTPYFKKIVVSSTMGPGLTIAHNALPY